MAYEHERAEWRSAVAECGPLQRIANCRHEYGRRGICIHCGDDEPRLNLGDRG